MSEFSTVLSRFVKEKDVNVYRLAKYCGYDRANLYKVMRGERKPPSLEVLNLLCEYMHLSPAEEEILEENYEITMVGHDNYYRRKNVMKFFSDFSMTSNLENVLPTVEIKEDFEIPNSSYMLLRGNYEINSALFHIIADETKNQKGHIQILAQPEHALGDTTVSEPTRESNGNAGENTGENTPGKVAGKLQIIKNVNMRNQPSTENSSILGVAKTGEVYEYYELVGDSWYHIRLSDGSEAYVYKEYVDVLN